MKAVRILTGFLAFFFCIALLAAEIGTGTLSVLQHFFTGDGIAEMVKSVDIKEVLAEQSDTGDYKEAIKEMVGDEFFGEELDEELIDELLESQTFEDLTALVGDAVVALMLGEDLENYLTPEALQQIFEDNAKEIVTLIDGEYTEERKEEILQIVTTESEAVFNEIDIEELSDTVESEIDKDVLEAARTALKPATLYIALAVCAILMLIIVALRLRKFGWLLWVGITTLLAGGLITGIGILIGPALELVGELPQAVLNLSSVIGGKFIMTGAIALGTALVLIILGIVLRFVVKKDAGTEVQPYMPV